MEDFDSMESVENILSSALGKGITTFAIYAVIAGIIIWIVVRLVKSGIKAIKTRAEDFARNLRDEEESKRKLLAWANKQDVLTQKQKEQFKKIAQEKAAFEASLTQNSNSNEVISWKEKVVRTKETYEAFRNKHKLASMPDGQAKNVTNFLMENFLEAKGQPLKMQVGQEHGAISSLDRNQFNYMVEGLLTPNELNRLQEKGNIGIKKSLAGHDLKINVSDENGLIKVEWLPKEIETVERVKEVTRTAKNDSRNNDIHESFDLDNKDFDLDIGFGANDSLEDMLNLDFDLDIGNIDIGTLDDIGLSDDLNINKDDLNRL